MHNQAWRKRANGDDASCHRRSGKRQPGNVAGKSDRRAVPERLTAKNGNRLLKARRALRQVIRGVSDVILTVAPPTLAGSVA